MSDLDKIKETIATKDDIANVKAGLIIKWIFIS